MSETAKTPASPSSPAHRPSVLSLNINSKSALYAAYMPLLKNGGIFIPTNRGYRVGDEVFIKKRKKKREKKITTIKTETDLSLNA